MIVSQKHSVMDRLRCIAMLARKAGCNYPTEETKALMTACAFHDATPEEAMQLAGDLGYNMLCHFKRFFTSTVVVVGGRHPISYPGFETFEAQHTILFSAAGFVPGSRDTLLSEDAIKKVEMIATMIPKRSTNNHVDEPLPATAGKLAKLEGICNLPGFRLCAPQERHIQPLQRCHTVPELPVIEDISIPPGQPNANPPPNVGHLALTDAPHVDSSNAVVPSNAVVSSNAIVPSTAVVPSTKAANQNDQPKATIAQMIDELKQARGEPRVTKKVALAKAKAKAKTKAKAKAKCAKAKSKNGGRCKTRSVHVEWSVSHVLARTGRDSHPKSKSFPFQNVAGVEAAKKLAWKWLQEVGPV